MTALLEYLDLGALCAKPEACSKIYDPVYSAASEAGEGGYRQLCQRGTICGSVTYPGEIRSRASWLQCCKSESGGTEFGGNRFLHDSTHPPVFRKDHMRSHDYSTGVCTISLV